MARLPRLVIPHQPHHVVQTALDNVAVFRAPEDYGIFLKWLRDAARQFKVAIHAYVLLPEGFQLLASPADEIGLSRMMQWMGRHYVPYFNGRYGRAGTLWRGRYKAMLIEADAYLLACSQYIEQLPVRAGLATAPADYSWSSHLHHIGSRSDPLVTDHPVYWALGNTPFDREAAYKALSEQGVSARQTQTLDQALHRDWPLGSEAFKAELAKQIVRPVQPGRRGRPARAKRSDSSI